MNKNQIIYRPPTGRRPVGEMGRLGNNPVPSNILPPDLRKFPLQNYADPSDLSAEMRAALGIEQLASVFTLNRGLAGRAVTVGLSQVSIAKAEQLRSYLFLNPAAGVGLTTELTALASTVVTDGAGSAEGNTQSSPIDVSTYREAHVFVNITDTNSAATAVSVWAQAQDPVSGEWADVQTVISTETAIGTYYAALGGIGVTSNLAFRWLAYEDPGPATATISIGVVLKDGLSRSPEEGVTNSIYLGPDGVTTETGYPLLEGMEKVFYLKENVELFAISKVAGLSLRVFEL